MRWISIVALSLGTAASGPVAASPAPAPPADPATDTFWRDVVEPHGATVAAIVARAKNAIGKAVAAADDDSIGRRARYLGDAYGMLRYAHKLSPQNTEVLSLLGVTADDLGKTRQALDALETCARLQGPEHTGPEVAGRLGMIYLRLGKLDAAIHWLRQVQAPLATTDSAMTVVHLATALAARGEMAQAIDVLTSTLPAQINYFTDPVTIVSFALAVHYDRDEQRAAALDVIDRMSGNLQHELGPFLQRALAALRFAPAEDELYYHALLYESLGHDAEARAEWALYASVMDAPWRRRALDHITAIDARRAASGAHPTARGGAAHRVQPHHPLVP